MKVGTKVKLLTLGSIISATIISLACASIDNTADAAKQKHQVDMQKWQTKAPQLFGHIGYAKLIESNTVEFSKLSKQQQELVGTITNPFGIRDDILEYILLNIPESNPRATIAAIKMAYYFQSEIGLYNDKEINALSNKAGAAMYCMGLPMQERYNFIIGYDKLERNTKERLAEQNRIEYLLNGHVISADFGIDTYDFKKQCDYFLGVSE